MKRLSLSLETRQRCPLSLLLSSTVSEVQLEYLKIINKNTPIGKKERKKTATFCSKPNYNTPENKSNKEAYKLHKQIIKPYGHKKDLKSSIC